MDRRPAADRIAGVDHRLAGEVRRAGEAQRVKRDGAADRQNDDLAERRRLGEAHDLRRGILRLPVGEFGGLARAERNLMAVLEKACAERRRDDARTDDAYFHEGAPEIAEFPFPL